MGASKRVLDIRWVIAIAVLLTMLCFSSAQAYYTVLGTDDITDWEYSSIYNSDWLNESFVSGWGKGDATFGRSTFSPITAVDQNQVYIRKILQLNDSTQGLIKVRAENNLKCYVNGNLIAENYKKLYSGSGMYQCYANYFQSGCRTGTAYYYGSYDAINDFIIVDVSKYLKKGTNVIACEAWVDKNAYYYNSGSRKYYTDGRLYLDINLYIMGTKSMMWSKTDTNYNKLSDNPVMFHETRQCVSDYECGYSSARTHAIVTEDRWSGAWQWGDAPITDGNYFKWTSTRDYPRTDSYINPIWPYDSSNLYLRKWIWSDSNITKTLKISDTKRPDCYLNEKPLVITSLNDSYWRYQADIELKECQNLIACKSPKAAANSFDMKIAEHNDALNISDVQVVSQTETDITLKVRIENPVQPVDVSLSAELYKDVSLLWNFWEYINKASDSESIKRTILERTYYSETMLNPAWYTCDGTLYSKTPCSRGFDNNWDTGVASQSTSRISLSEGYTIKNLAGINERDVNITGVDYRYYAQNIGGSSLVANVYDFKNSKWVTIYNSSEEWAGPIIHLDDSNNYVSSSNEIKFQMPVYSWFSESEMSFNATIDNSKYYIEKEFTIPLSESGTYDLVFAAKDNIDGDSDVYSTSIDISLGGIDTNESNGTANVLGFFPTEGNSDESGKSTGSTAIVIGISAAAAGAATLGGVYLISGSGSGFSLKKMDTSLSRASNAINTLNTMSDAKAAANENSFWNTMIQRYDDFKSKWNAIEEEKRRIKEEREREAKRRAAIEIKDAQLKVKEMLAAPLGKGESLKDKYNQVNAFMNSKGISSAGEEYEKFKKFNEDSEAGRMDLSDPSWHWSATRMAQQGEAIRSQIGNQYTMQQLSEMGFISTVDGNYVFDNQGYDAFVNPPKPQINDNEHLPYSELYDQKTGWEKFTGALGGLLGFAQIDSERKKNMLTDIFSSISQGDFSGAWNRGLKYAGEEVSSFVSGITNNWQMIAGAAIAGAGVAFIAGTVGIGTPVGVALIAAGGAMMFNNIRYRYAEPLNEINDFYRADTQYMMEGYWKVRENLVGDSAAIAAGMGSYYGTAGYVNPVLWKYNYGVDTPKLAFDQKITLTNQWSNWREGILRLNDFSNINKISIVPGDYIDYWGHHFYNGNVRLNFNAFSECPGAVTVVASHEAIENFLYQKYDTAYFNTGGIYDYGKQEIIVENINRAYLGEETFTKSFSESVKAEIKQLEEQIPSDSSIKVEFNDPIDIKTQAKNLAVLKNIDPALYTELKTTLLKLNNGGQIISMSEYYSNIFNQDWSFLVQE